MHNENDVDLIFEYIAKASVLLTLGMQSTSNTFGYFPAQLTASHASSKISISL